MGQKGGKKEKKGGRVWKLRISLREVLTLQQTQFSLANFFPKVGGWGLVFFQFM